jgi:hypothetical protein
MLVMRDGLVMPMPRSGHRPGIGTVKKGFAQRPDEFFGIGALLRARIERVERLAPGILEVVVHAPLAARRVPGVTTMPYERLGFTLLAGWNGVQTASDMRAADKPPATGTLWAGSLVRHAWPGQGAGQGAARTGYHVVSGLVDRGGPALINQRFGR